MNVLLLHMFIHSLLHYGQSGIKYNTQDSHTLVRSSKCKDLKILILSAKGKCKPILHVYGCRWYGRRLRYYTCIKEIKETLFKLFLELWCAWESGIQYPGYWMLLEDQKRKGEVWGVLVKHTGCWVIKEEGTLASKRDKST